MLHAADHGAVTLQDDEGNAFKTNGQRLKIFLEPQMPKIEDLDCLDFRDFSPSED